MWVGSGRSQFVSSEEGAGASREDSYAGNTSRESASQADFLGTIGASFCF